MVNASAGFIFDDTYFSIRVSRVGNEYYHIARAYFPNLSHAQQ